MTNSLKAALAALLAASATSIAALPAQAQMIGDENTTVGGAPIYVEEENVDRIAPGHNGLTISGAVGLPLNPTAQVPAKGAVRVQANYYQLFKNNDSGARATSRLYGIYAAGGATDRLEISGGVEKNSISGDDDGPFDALDKTGIAVGAKYLLSEPGGPEDIRVAVGAGYSSALYKNANVYAVASKGFSAGTRVVTGHLGIRYDRFKIGSGLTGSAISSSKVSVFAGAEVPIDKRGRFNVVGEVQSKNANSDMGGAAPYSLSLRFQNGGGLSASIGIMRQGIFGDPDIADESSGLFLNIGKTF